MIKENLRRKSHPKINFKNGTVEMAHGSGGKAMHQLIEQLFFKYFANEFLLQQNDQATISMPEGRLVMTTDGHVVSPLFFPGGDIGSLAVHGIINDMAVGGATPHYLTASFILEEGFPLRDLQKIVISMAEAADKAGVSIVTGDTKVVEKGKGDGVYITTTGIGIVPKHVNITNHIKAGDKVIVSGFIGDHGIAVMSKRNNLQYQTEITSDSAALHELTAKMLEVVPNIHCMRDPTRGGIAATLNEWANFHGVGFSLDESAIPIREPVYGACELLGIDPLYVANEGKLAIICAENDVEKLLQAMHENPLGQDAAVIGEVVEDEDHFVQMKTAFGGTRIVDWLAGDQLPRIC